MMMMMMMMMIYFLIMHIFVYCIATNARPPSPLSVALYTGSGELY